MITYRNFDFEKSKNNTENVESLKQNLYPLVKNRVQNFFLCVHNRLPTSSITFSELEAGRFQTLVCDNESNSVYIIILSKYTFYFKLKAGNKATTQTHKEVQLLFKRDN